MKKLILLLLLLIAMPVYGAEYAVRPPSACPNNGNGASWACAASAGAAGAMNTIPSAIEHGSTYYIGGGAYGRVSFGVISYSGEDYAYVKKATTTAHGSEVLTNWNDTYAVQATFEQMNIEGHYIDLDGVTGSGTTGYGIKIEHPAADLEYNNDLASLWLYGSGSPYGVNYVTVQNIEVSMTSGTDCSVLDQAYLDGYEPSTYTIKGARGTFEGIQIKNNYIHGGSTNIQMGAWTQSSITGNYFGQNCSRAWSHGQQISPTGGSSYITLANNEFHDSETYIVGAHNNGVPGAPNQGNSYWYIYNNISIGGTQSYQAAESQEYDCLMSSQIHHNTFIDGACAPEGSIDSGAQQNLSTTKSYAYNNLFYNMTQVRIGQDCGVEIYDDLPFSTPGCTVHDNNAFLYSSGYVTTIEDELAEQVDAEAPSTIFTDYDEGDYTINAADQTVIDHIIDKGKTDLGLLYKDDRAGNERDASPDIGAYEYVGAADTVAPASPTGLSVT